MSRAERRFHLVPEGPCIAVAADPATLDDLGRYIAPCTAEAPPTWRVEAAWGDTAPTHGMAAGAFTTRDDELDIVTRWRPAQRTITIHAGDGVPRYNLVQTIYAAGRTLLHAALGTAGPVRVVHGGAVSVGGNGVLLLGEKGAGKTTLTTALLAEGADYIASDRAFLRPDGGSLAIAGWVCTYRLDPGRLAPLLDHDALERVMKYVGEHRSDPEYSFGGKFRFPPRDLLRLCGFSEAPETPLACVVEITDPARHGCVIESGTPDDLRAALKRHDVEPAIPPQLSPGRNPTTFPDDPGRLPFFRVAGRDSPRRMASALLDRIAMLPGP